MKAGDRVTTPDGPGTVTGLLTHEDAWHQYRPIRTVYVIVQLNDKTTIMYRPHQLEATMSETTTTETVETTTTPEPDPDPETTTDPEPDQDQDDDDEAKGQVEWP